MTPTEYIRPLIRPDLALLRQERKRGWLAGLLAGGKDRALRGLLAGAPFAAGEAEAFAEAALDWCFYSLTPADRGLNHMPQTVDVTLHTLSGDCDDGAILLGTMLVSALHPDAWPLFKLCVGAVNSRSQHAFLTMDRRDLGDVVMLDWTISPRPCESGGEAVWQVQSSVDLRG